MHIVQAKHYTRLQELQIAVPVPESIYGKNLWETYHWLVQSEAGISWIRD